MLTVEIRILKSLTRAEIENMENLVNVYVENNFSDRLGMQYNRLIAAQVRGNEI